MDDGRHRRRRADRVRARPPLEKPMRPVLKPALRRHWRDAETLQLGSDPAVAVVLTGLQAGERVVLDLLDGRRSESAVLTAAADAGVAPRDAERLLCTLRGAGALEDADAPDPLAGLSLLQQEAFRPELAALSLRTDRPRAAADAFRRRQGATVVVLGAGRLGAPIVALLVAAGVGVVDVRDATLMAPADSVPGGLSLADVGRPREEAVRTRVPDAARSRRVGSWLGIDLAVLAPPPGDEAATPEQLRRDGVPHLAVQTVDGAGIVGPLVCPGVSACLRCFDLHRADRDPTWLGLRASTDAHAVCDAAVTVATAALAAVQVLAFLDAPDTGAPPAAVGGTLELRAPDWRLRRRSWAPHPDCGCTR